MRFTRNPGSNSWGMDMGMGNPGFGSPFMGVHGNYQAPQSMYVQSGGMGLPMQGPQMQVPPVMQASPMQVPPMPGYPPMPGGTIRNNLGSELKKRGIFQKDGQIQNLRGGFIGAKTPKAPIKTPFSFLSSGGSDVPQMSQLILEPTQEGLVANGIASISPDNVFSCIANLPSPESLMGGGTATYAAYLADSKGKTGFLAGVLRPIGTGVYRTQFRSQVPLHHYSRVLVTLENPQNLAQYPQGPVVLQVKQAAGPIRMLEPMKKAGGSVWNKLSGLIKKKPAAEAVPEVLGPTEGATLVQDMSGMNGGTLNSGGNPGSNYGANPASNYGVNPGNPGTGYGGGGAIQSGAGANSGANLGANYGANQGANFVASPPMNTGPNTGLNPETSNTVNNPMERALQAGYPGTAGAAAIGGNVANSGSVTGVAEVIPPVQQ